MLPGETSMFPKVRRGAQNVPRGRSGSQGRRGTQGGPCMKTLAPQMRPAQVLSGW